MFAGAPDQIFTTNGSHTFQECDCRRIYPFVFFNFLPMLMSSSPVLLSM
jgi:hypothetical protein